jgi:hypothetical protein
MKDLIRKVLREELTNKQQMLVDLTKSSGFKTASNAVGGIDNYINILYGGDFKKFIEDNNIQVVKFSNDGMNMYIHPLLADLLGAKDKKFLGADYLNLGKFRYGTQGTNGSGYSFNAELMPMKQNGEVVNYKVVGTSGDSGFGYSFITKRNTLGKRNRQQIFKQIIDKYGLEQYIK